MRKPILAVLILSASSCSLDQRSHRQEDNIADVHTRLYPDGPIPTADQAKKIEKTLIRHPCIRDPARWQRSYFFEIHPDTRLVNGDMIGFVYREAGKFEFKEGTRLVSPGGDLETDDRSYQIAIGTYRAPSNQIVRIECGANMPQ